MKTIHHSQIIVPESRQRKLFDSGKLGSLAASIEKVGLLQPIILRNDGRTLVAGERRFRAITQYAFAVTDNIKHDGTDLPDGHIPFIRVGDLNDHGLSQAELDENDQREALTWQERTAALAELHAKLVEENPAHTKLQTAELLLESGEADASRAAPRKDEVTVQHMAKGVQRAVVVSEHLHVPEVAAATTLASAKRIVDRIRRAELASAAPPTPETDRFKLEHGPFQTCSLFADGGADMVVADPPYGVDADSTYRSSAMGHSYDDSPAVALATYSNLFECAMRWMKEGTYFVCWFDMRHYETLKNLALDHGFKWWHYPLIWRRTTGPAGDPSRMPVRRYETALILRKGDTLLSGSIPDVLSIEGSGTAYGAEKPPELYGEFYKAFLPPRGVVYDPCCGSGPSIAALPPGASIRACDISEAAYNQARSRVSEATAQGVLAV